MTDRAMPIPDVQVEEYRSEWPKDELLPEEGAVRITGRYVDPRLNDRSLRNGLLLWLTFLVVSFFGPPQLGAGVLVGFLPIWLVAAVVFYQIGKPELDVKIAAGEIKLAGKTYSRPAVIEFRVERHHKAMEEQHKEMNTGKRTRTTYRQAVEVVMQYGEKRVVIAEMLEKDQEKARALVIRLQNWCDRFDQLLVKMAEKQNAAAPPLTAQADEFGPAPPIR